MSDRLSISCSCLQWKWWRAVRLTDGALLNNPASLSCLCFTHLVSSCQETCSMFSMSTPPSSGWWPSGTALWRCLSKASSSESCSAVQTTSARTTTLWGTSGLSTASRLGRRTTMGSGVPCPTCRTSTRPSSTWTSWACSKPNPRPPASYCRTGGPIWDPTTTKGSPASSFKNKMKKNLFLLSRNEFFFKCDWV